MRQQLLDLHEIQKIDVEIREIETQGATVSQRLAQLETSTNGLRKEVQTLTDQRENTTREIKTQALKEGMLSLRMDGLEKLKRGITSPEEILKESAPDE